MNHSTFLDNHSVKEIKCGCGVVARSLLSMKQAQKEFTEQGWRATMDGETLCPACVTIRSAMKKRAKEDDHG